MNKATAKADGLLLLTAFIWGFAFVAQRIGMEYVGPFIFNGCRFLLGAAALIPLAIYHRHQDTPTPLPQTSFPKIFKASLFAGLMLFGGASFQQVGLVYTTAGKAGFITGLYVVIVPFLGLFLRHPATDTGTWLGAGLAVVGLYFLSMTDTMTLQFGDFLELLGAFLWAAHVMIIAHFSPRMGALELAMGQFLVCGLLSLTTGLMIEPLTWSGLMGAVPAIAYGGLLSVGIAYTLQVVAQKNAPPAHAAILLSLEAVFAALGGWLILDEFLTPRGLLGCGLMLTGMLSSQLWSLVKRRR